MHDLLKGRIALVTGAGQGNGRGLAVGLARWGADVVITDVNADAAAETARQVREIGRKAWSYLWDVSDRAAGAALARQVEADAGDVSILINNAGIIFRGDSDSEEALTAWKRVLGVNLDGTYYATMSFLSQLKRTRGSVINIGSVQSFLGLATKGAAYASSKGAVLLLTKELAVELAPFGVRVNGIAPGIIRTPINPWIENDPQKRDLLLKRVPLGRVGEPEELVGAAVFLAADLLGSYVTGTMIPVDGGFLAM
ncbi:SDR family oxidoreductase [Bradyrhizobium sp. U87765 SZCCT0131]|uniref:SDR family NAD(P)-dependent oxidoreductase n=1 Tax=unclassified Bradyrhizobium TaxID=2631580 RepID=UPI001BAC05EF|nr:MULTISPECIES: SDR family oxidoreductase [unclassified Bradyrhizobium]MBR1220723.1 SDR family oxidoreductase [Bradyrhizobium sp. U87765 SZCCT0131]MBR1260457.1 SDR family oxidoreductase [Bradyrhizobium sp. U87765 SZCCT0134]MBR1307294.1 SDR family oxidoreductase [Bradyrhizobium sp. U87765 SZCCT0110]MBR1321248.1 SDR family oxidoreductase [Bradyrhizobium sp. U87765 SZCCT0109]MBR1349561.1 SDR family oxidoreductase [Bradyrhizobium sp. U87765 SZCCT0048]